MSHAILEQLRREKIVAIIRGLDASAADSTASALVDGGVRLLEVTLNTEGALAMIARGRKHFGEGVCIGAGTVLDLDMAQQALAAGAQFLISPNVDEEVIAHGRSHGVEVWPGALTLTEIVRAWNAGARAVKLFPAGAFGLSYFRDVQAPLGHIPMIAVGRINLDNAADFLRAGAVAVGVGGDLVRKELIDAGDFNALAELAAQYVSAVQK